MANKFAKVLLRCCEVCKITATFAVGGGLDAPSLILHGRTGIKAKGAGLGEVGASVYSDNR